MKKVFRKFPVFVIAALLMMPASLMAQNDKSDQDNNGDKEMKDKMKEKQDVQVITITRKGDKDQKTTVEINGDNITVNGKPIDDLKDGDVSVRVNKIKDMRAFGRGQSGAWNFNGNGGGMSFFSGDENKAMLGVTTEKVDKGVEIQDVTKESGAEKAGLKEKDIITKIDDQKVEDPDGLSEAIGKYKPGDKVKVTYLRDGKEQTTTAELTKWKGFSLLGTTTPGYNYNYNFSIPKVEMPNIPQGELGQLWNYSVGGRPRLGLSVQDTEDGKGVKVIDIDDEGNAEKAGIKKDDVITEVDGKAVNSADEVAKIVRDSRDKSSLMFKIQRSGKTQNIEVKIPRKLKTADL